jgi:hypothetical protein
MKDIIVMKRFTLALLGVILFSGMIGCAGYGPMGRGSYGAFGTSPCGRMVCDDKCAPCYNQKMCPATFGGLLGGGGRMAPCGPNGALMGQCGPYGCDQVGYQYPYYQVRGPRDFLAENPMPIGP